MKAYSVMKSVWLSAALKNQKSPRDSTVSTGKKKQHSVSQIVLTKTVTHRATGNKIVHKTTAREKISKLLQMGSRARAVLPATPRTSCSGAFSTEIS